MLDEIVKESDPKPWLHGVAMDVRGDIPEADLLEATPDDRLPAVPPRIWPTSTFLCLSKTLFIQAGSLA